MEYKITTYKELEWYIINETEKEKLLLLRDSLTNEQIAKYFLEKAMVDFKYCVKFNDKQSPWWDESYIRKILNTRFLSDLDKNDLYQMKTTLELNGERKIIEDYVRLLTYEEAKNLPLEIRKTKRKYGYWTMSPCYFNGNYAVVFYVYGSSPKAYGYLSYNNVDTSYAIRPLISLKPDNLRESIITITQASPLITNQLSREEIIKRLKRAKNI